ncbi:MAG: monovalent cation/H(+) antiporter subunit G [Pseudomonadota bacterium]
MDEIAAAALLILGGVFCFAASLGLVRFPDVYMRMHAATKAGTLGMLFIAIAIVFVSPSVEVMVRALLVALFVLITAPIGSHLVGRAAYRTGAPRWAPTLEDEGCRAVFAEHRREPEMIGEPAAETAAPPSAAASQPPA